MPRKRRRGIGPGRRDIAKQEVSAICGRAGFLRFCIENGMFWKDKAYTLEPGASRTLVRTIGPVGRK